MPFVIDVDPVALRLAGIEIRWYGLILVAASAVAYAVARRESSRLSLPTGIVADASPWVAVAAVMGGRGLYELQNGLPDLAAHPDHLLMVWMGGLSFYGGLAAGLAALVLFARHRGVLWLTALDAAAPAAAIGQAIGHVGCLVGGDSFGVPTDAPWAVIYRNPNAMAPLGAPLHPTQAYEALALAALFVALLMLRRRLSGTPGAVAALYLGGLATVRFVLFFLRDEPPVLLGLKTAQLIGLGVLVAAAALYLVAQRRAGRPGAQSVPLEAARS